MEARVITPQAPGTLERAREFWTARRLVPYFGRRLLEKRYLRTWVGWPWIPLRPLLDVGSRALLFGGLLGIPSQGIPYPIFLLVGTAAWQLFDRTAFWAMRSLEINRSVLRRLYVPRLTVVAGAIVPSGAEFVVYVLMTLVVAGGYWIGEGELYFSFGADTPLLAAGLVLLLAIAYSIGLFLSVYAAQARDVRFIFNYVLGFWLFLTPVFYPLSAIPEGFQTVAEFNPITAPVEMVKLGVLGVGEVTTRAVVTSLVFLAVVGTAGLRFFNAAERRTLDSF